MVLFRYGEGAQEWCRERWVSRGKMAGKVVGFVRARGKGLGKLQNWPLGFNIKALKDALRKLKGKALANDAVTSHSIASEMLNVDVKPLNPRLLNYRLAHSNYLKHTQEEAVILREIMEQRKSQNPLNAYLDYACAFRKPIAVETDTPKHVVTLVYSRKPRKSKSTDLVSKSKVIKFVTANKKGPSKSWGSTISNVPSSSLDE
nr:hypothetical protein [Tanacetum cinerariifolium]